MCILMWCSFPWSTFKEIGKYDKGGNAPSEGKAQPPTKMTEYRGPILKRKNEHSAQNTTKMISVNQVIQDIYESHPSGVRFPYSRLLGGDVAGRSHTSLSTANCTFCEVNRPNPMESRNFIVENFVVVLLVSKHLENYIASLVLACLKHLMLVSELHLFHFNLAVRGLNCFGASSLTPVDKQQLGFWIGVASLQP